MAGKGPAPKRSEDRIRRNKGAEIRVVEVDTVDQPSLQEVVGELNPATDMEFSEGTLRLWEELRDFATTGLLQGAQWSLLARAMVLDDAVMRGELKWASESRLQMAKFGIAPDDVLRMRVQVVQADEAEEKRETVKGSRGSRWGDLKAVEGGQSG